MRRFGAAVSDLLPALRLIREGRPPRDNAELERIVALYDAEVFYVDEALGRFFNELKDRGLYDASLIVVTSDHGEAFYEHDSWEHTETLYQEIIHIPLLIKWPGNERRGRFSLPVSQSDVFATLLSGAGLSAPHGHAADLDALYSGVDSGRPIISEIVWADSPPVGKEIALLNRNLKYIVRFDTRPGDEFSIGTVTREQLYDLGRDPFERDDLASVDPPVLDSFRSRLKAYLQMAREHRQGRTTEEITLDETTLDELRAIGYVP